MTGGTIFARPPKFTPRKLRGREEGKSRDAGRGYFSGLGPQIVQKLKKEILKEAHLQIGAQFGVVARGGIEPPTQGFSVLRSTTELPGHLFLVLRPALRDYQAT